MIVDTSAIMAMLLAEAEALVFSKLLLASDRCAISAGSWIELAAVITRRNLDDRAFLLTSLMHEARIEIAAITAAQAEIGHQAYRKYGIGSGHRAHLNFGDCFAYALAKETGEPLLYKGDDFVHTDVLAAA